LTPVNAHCGQSGQKDRRGRVLLACRPDPRFSLQHRLFLEVFTMAGNRSIIPTSSRALFGGGPDPFGGLRDDLERLLLDVGQRWPFAGLAGEKHGFLLPKMDVAETEAGLELTAELPGFEDKDVSLDIQDGILTLKAEHKTEHEEKDEKRHYHLVERSQGSFLRRFALPFEADADKASAHLDKGLLKVVVPRLASEARKPTHIPVGSK
jgi:HSP20 family protein